MVYNAYVECIKRQFDLSPEQWYFKSDNNYKGILEHVSPSLGSQYLRIIQQKFPEFYQTHSSMLSELCSFNDLYGKTTKVEYAGFANCSPSNLRYILHSLLVLEDMKKYGLREVDVIEIGGGYGGLCLFLQKLSPLYDIKLNSYGIFDLPEASQLQKRYLRALGVEVNIFQLDGDMSGIKTNSFLISNYAFSEIRMDLQEKYISQVINPYTKFGFLAWNHSELYHFVENSVIEREIEYPQTSDGFPNQYVRYFRY